MLPEDQKRLERERDIAKATSGPDYSQRDADVSRVKAEAQRRKRVREEFLAHRRAGYRMRVLRGEIGMGP